MADRDLVPVSWDGNNINDTTNYTSGFRPGLEWGLPAVSANLATRIGRWPILSGVSRSVHRLTLEIVIMMF